MLQNIDADLNKDVTNICTECFFFITRLQLFERGYHISGGDWKLTEVLFVYKPYYLGNIKSDGN